MAVGEDLLGEVLEPELTDIGQMVELVLSIPVMHRRVMGEVDHSAEHGDIERRHLLAAYDHPAVDRCLLYLLTPVHVHPRTAYTVVCSLDDLNDPHVERVLVFVQVNHSVRTHGQCLGQRRCRCVPEVQRAVADGEEPHQRYSKLRLSGSFRSEQVKEWEIGCI